MNVRTMLGILGMAAASAAASRADDWPAFRGPSGTGVSSEKSAPTQWSAEKNLRWKAPLPQPGNGSPIVSNGRVFVACAQDEEGKRRSLHCFDRMDGKSLWVRTVEFGRQMPTHEDNPYCGSTPAADGERVVVWHATAGLHCYDFEGKELWARDLGEFRHLWGYGSSPVISGGKVILNAAPGKKPFLTALDLKTGKTIWETPEPYKGDGEKNAKDLYMGSWSTPVVTTVEGKEQILCAMPTRLVGYDPLDGRILWWCEGLSHKRGDLAYSSPIVGDGVCVVIGGYSGSGIGVRLGGRGDVTQTHRLWRSEENPQSIGTGVFLGGRIFLPFETPSNSIDCLDPKTGKSIWRERRAGAGFWGSMTSAGGLLYVTDTKGATLVVRPNEEKYELVARNELGEGCNSTPAVSDGRIFIRTFNHLYCIGE